MSGVGAVGGGSGAAGVSAGVTAGGSGVSAAGGESSGGSSNKTDAADFVGAGQQPNLHSHSPCSGMSTEDTLKLHQTVQQPSGASEGGLDLKKLIELLMAIKLMEAINQDGGSSVGNNLDITA